MVSRCCRAPCGAPSPERLKIAWLVRLTIVGASLVAVWARGLLRDNLSRLGIGTTFIDDIDDGDAGEAAIRPETRALFAESISNAANRLIDIAAIADPVAAQLGQAGHDVDTGFGIGIGARAVIDAQRGFAAGGLEVNLAHRDAERTDMDLLAAADRAGGDLQLGAGGDVGHSSLLLRRERTVFG